MPTVEERLAALEKQMAAWMDQRPTTYYTHKYSGEEIDDAVGKIRSGAGEGAVRYDQAQTLTPAQQSQAQANIGTTWPCNPNLLDNPTFAIWQRYQDGNYTGAPNGSYISDRWIITSSNGAITSNLTKATPYGGLKNASGPNCRITQRLENAEQYNGRTLTLSVLKNNGLHTTTIVPNGWTDATDVFAAFSAAVAWLNSGESILAAKLELGPTQTLAHREGDRWVLNEIPDYGEQLRRCQRYFYRVNSHAYGWTYNNNTVNCLIPLPVTLRTSPVITLNGSGTINTVKGDASMTSYEVKNAKPNGLIIDLHNSANALTTGTPVVWHNFDIDISADL